MLKWFAPILSFTTEEIFRLVNCDNKSIHLEQFLKFPDNFKNEQLNQKWIELIKIRNTCNISIEEKRASKEIGSSLEASLIVNLNKKNYTNPAMEAEFGIKLNCDLNPNLISSDYIIDSIESIYPLIEIHNLIFYGDAPHGAELLANNAIHAGVILGPENKPPKKNISTDLKLIYNKEIIDTWPDKKWPHDILSEVQWLAKELAKINITLKKITLF